MLRGLIACGLALAAVITAVPAAAMERVRIGDWFLSTDVTEGGDRFCTATGPSTVDSALQLAFLGEQFIVAVLSERWTDRIGRVVPLQAAVDDRWGQMLLGRIMSEKYLMVEFARDDPVLEHLRAGRQFNISRQSNVISFDLTGSADIIEALILCSHGLDWNDPADPRSAGADGGGTSTGQPPSDPTVEPLDIGPVAVGGDRPNPTRYIVPHVEPLQSFEVFASSVARAVPGDPLVERTEPGNRFADYEFRGEAEGGFYFGKYFAVAPQGATIVDLLNREMSVSEATCTGDPRSVGRGGERIGGTSVVWEVIDCGGDSGVQFRAVLVSGDGHEAQIITVFGEPSTYEVAVALYDMLRNQVRQR